MFKVSHNWVSAFELGTNHEYGHVLSNSNMKKVNILGVNKIKYFEIIINISFVMIYLYL